MSEMKRTYEQYCTHIGGNVVMEETLSDDGTLSVHCTNGGCSSGAEGCQNKLTKINGLRQNN